MGKRQRHVRRQAGSRPFLRSVIAQAELQATMHAHMEEFADRLARPRSQRGCSHPNTVQFEPCDVGNSGCFAKVKQPSATRGSHSAWGRCQASVAFVSLSSQLAQSHQKAMCLPADLLTLPKHLQSWLRFGVDPGVATTETEDTEVLNGGRSGGRGLP